MSVPSIAKEIIKDIKCSCDDCKKYFNDFLGSLVNEFNFCEMKHLVLLENISPKTQQEFNDELDKRNYQICKDLNNSLEITVFPICLPNEIVMEIPLNTKFLFDKISFKKCVAFKSHYLVTVYTRKLVYAMNNTLAGLSLHNPIMNNIENNTKKLLLLITGSLNDRIKELEQNKKENDSQPEPEPTIKKEIDS